MANLDMVLARTAMANAKRAVKRSKKNNSATSKPSPTSQANRKKARKKEVNSSSFSCEKVKGTWNRIACRMLKSKSYFFGR